MLPPCLASCLVARTPRALFFTSALLRARHLVHSLALRSRRTRRMFCCALPRTHGCLTRTPLGLPRLCLAPLFLSHLCISHHAWVALSALSFILGSYCTHLALLFTLSSLHSPCTALHCLCTLRTPLHMGFHLPRTSSRLRAFSALRSTTAHVHSCHLLLPCLPPTAHTGSALPLTAAPALLRLPFLLTDGSSWPSPRAYTSARTRAAHAVRILTRAICAARWLDSLSLRSFLFHLLCASRTAHPLRAQHTPHFVRGFAIAARALRRARMDQAFRA